LSVVVNHPLRRCWRCGLSAYDNIGQNERTPHLSITTSYRHSLRRFLPVFAGAPLSYNRNAAGYTYCICSKNSAIVLSYQWLPTSIQCGEAMARRRKEDRQMGSASRGMVRRWGRFFSRVRHRGVPDRDKASDRCNSLWAAVDVCSDAPAGAQRAECMADGRVVDVSRALSVSPRAP
jgi:hypothetical protein